MIIHNGNQEFDQLFYDTADIIAGEFAGRERLPLLTGSVAVRSELLDVEAKETLADQLTFAFQGYEETVKILNSLHNPSKHIPIASKVEMATEFMDWFNVDRQRRLLKAQADDPFTQFILLATPNVRTIARDIMQSAKVFELRQPMVAEIWSELIQHYNDEQLSGTNPENRRKFAFSWMPTSFTPGMDGWRSEQLEKFAEQKAQDPYLKIPSALDAITYWQTLRAHGDELTQGKVYDRTYIRHFDLPSIRIGGERNFVPSTYIGDDGKPYIDISAASSNYPARLALG